MSPITKVAMQPRQLSHTFQLIHLPHSLEKAELCDVQSATVQSMVIGQPCRVSSLQCSHALLVVTLTAIV